PAAAAGRSGRGAAAAPEASREQRREVQGLIEDMRTLGGAQLVSGIRTLRTELTNALERRAALNRQLTAVTAAIPGQGPGLARLFPGTESNDPLLSTEAQRALA